MLTLNLLPTSNVAFSKSRHNHSMDASFFSNPYSLQRIQRRSVDRVTICQNLTPGADDYGTKMISLSRVHEYAVGFSSSCGLQIPDSSSKIRNSSRLFGAQCRHPSNRTHPIRAGPEVPQESKADGEGGEVAKPKTLQLAIIFGLWYFQNIVFNIYNKKVLNVFPFPWFLASFQLFVGSVWMLFLWSSKLQPCPKISKPFIVALLGPALFHTVGHVSACVSFSKVAVSFTHVIKSSEPVFSVIFSSFLGDSYPLQVWLSILPIVFGCSVAAITEVSFNAQGLWGALISNVGFVLRNIYSKRSLQSYKEVNGLNLYGCISVISLLYLFPVAVFVEGSYWVEGYRQAIQSMGKLSTFYIWLMASGVFYHLYNQSSYQALDDISPLTFSVGNTMKRVVVIVSSVLVFRNPVRPLNAVGSAIAVLGTFLYSQAATAKSAKKIDGGKKG